MRYPVNAFNPFTTRTARNKRRKAYLKSLPASVTPQSGAGILLVAQDTGRVLLLQRALPDNGAGYWCPPGGGCDLGETAEEGAIRETYEECGYLCLEDLSVVSVGHPNENYTFTNFAAFIDKEFEPKLSWEHCDWRWVDNFDDIALYPPFAAQVLPILKGTA